MPAWWRRGTGTLVPCCGRKARCRAPCETRASPIWTVERPTVATPSGDQCMRRKADERSAHYAGETDPENLQDRLSMKSGQPLPLFLRPPLRQQNCCRLKFGSLLQCCWRRRNEMLLGQFGYIELDQLVADGDRRADWVACGGQPNGQFSLDRRKQLPDESSRDFRTRLEFEFQRCMLRSGYRYTGNCSSEYTRARPLCGVP